MICLSPNGSPAPGLSLRTMTSQFLRRQMSSAIKSHRLLSSSTTESDAKTHFRLCEDDAVELRAMPSTRSLSDGTWKHLLTPIAYRPFDTQVTIYDRTSQCTAAIESMRHYVGHPNIGIMLRSSRTRRWDASIDILPSFRTISSDRLIFSTKGVGSSSRSISILMKHQRRPTPWRAKPQPQPRSQALCRHLQGRRDRPSRPGRA